MSRFKSAPNYSKRRISVSAEQVAAAQQVFEENYKILRAMAARHAYRCGVTDEEQIEERIQNALAWGWERLRQVSAKRTPTADDARIAVYYGAKREKTFGHDKSAEYSWVDGKLGNWGSTSVNDVWQRASLDNHCWRAFATYDPPPMD